MLLDFNSGIHVYLYIWIVTLFFSIIIKSPPIFKRATVYNSRRVYFLFSVLALTWLAVLSGLSILWYKTDSKEGFHWFNDNYGWLQIDKVGHLFTTFQECRLIMLMVMWTGISKPNAIRWGFFGGMMFQCPIELLDGFQRAYGASWGDIVANTCGALLFYLQMHFWNELRFIPKFSVSAHPLSFTRPSFFGENFFQKIIKDYNGQTYWLSLDIPFLYRMLFWPKWLVVSVGYGANGMLGGEDNIFNDKEGIELDYSHVIRCRQWIISLDINWDRVSPRSGWLQTTIPIISLIKLPAPAIEYNEVDGLRLHWLYF